MASQAPEAEEVESPEPEEESEEAEAVEEEEPEKRQITVRAVVANPIETVKGERHGVALVVAGLRPACVRFPPCRAQEC